jgi:hypothetical protein
MTDPCYNMSIMYARALKRDNIFEMQGKYVKWLDEHVEQYKWWAGGEQFFLNGSFYTGCIFFEHPEDLLAFTLVFGSPSCPVVD